MGARCDFVWLVFETERTDPRDASKTYHSNSFDVMRIQNGKVQEHWDSAQRNKGSGVIATGVSPKPPMQWNTGKLSKEEQKTLALTTVRKLYEKFRCRRLRSLATVSTE